MAISIQQIFAASFEAVAARKPQNQWSQSSFLKEMERQGGIKRQSMGNALEIPLDHRRTPNSGFLATDMATTSLTKSEVLTAASYDLGQLEVQVVWSKGDEAKNPTENQKVALVKSLIENALESHDDLIEEACFTTSTSGFLGLGTLLPDNGQGTVGGINAAVETWWRNYEATYAANGSDILAQLAEAFNESAKGTGGTMPSLLVSDAETQAIYESVLADQIRFIDTKEADGGFKVLAYKTARWVFSQYAGTDIRGFNPKHFAIYASKEAYRQRGDTMEIPNAPGFVTKVYSMLQFATGNKSRGFHLARA